LQRLFAEMLLLNQQACSSIRLTDSFGWQSNEVFFLINLFFYLHSLSLLDIRSSRCSRTKSFTFRCYTKVFARHQTIESNSNVLRRYNNKLHAMSTMPEYIQTNSMFKYSRKKSLPLYSRFQRKIIKIYR